MDANEPGKQEPEKKPFELTDEEAEQLSPSPPEPPPKSNYFTDANCQFNEMPPEWIGSNSITVLAVALDVGRCNALPNISKMSDEEGKRMGRRFLFASQAWKTINKELRDIAAKQVSKERRDEKKEQSESDKQASALVAAAVDGSDQYPSSFERPCYRTYIEPHERRKVGLYYHGFDDKGNLTNLHLCSPLRVLAETRGRNDSDYGLLVEFKNENGWKQWCVPQEMMVGEAPELKRELMRNGLKITVAGERQLIKYFREFESQEKLWSTSSTGWDDMTSFVLPERVIGKGDVYFQSRSIVAPYGSRGTFEGWKSMAALAKGNPILMLSISSSFAGPLLKPLRITGGGIHLFGDSSTGKSTAQRASVSTWGGEKFKVSWNRTGNGLEGIAVTRTDTFLALDEINEVRDVKIVGEAAYALVNGSGRGRAQQNGEMREEKSWRAFTLSSGERTIEAVLAKDQIEIMAGQQVRFLDVDAASSRYGAFAHLHGRESGAAFSADISRLAAEHFGWAGPAFVMALIELGMGSLVARHAELVKKLKPADGQESRAAFVFALCALAGNLAAEFGVVPWDSGEATAAAKTAFDDWRLRTRNDSAAMTSQEDVQILRRLVDGIERYEDTKFSDIRFGDLQKEEVTDKDGKPVVDSEGNVVLKSISHRVNGERFGYWETFRDEVDDTEGLQNFDDPSIRRRYFVSGSGLKIIMRGFDHSRVKAALKNVEGALFSVGPTTVAKNKNIPGKGAAKLYHIDLAPIRLALDGD